MHALDIMKTEAESLLALSLYITGKFTLTTPSNLKDNKVAPLRMAHLSRCGIVCDQKTFAKERCGSAC